MSGLLAVPLRILVALVVVFCAAVLAELVPGMARLGGWLAENRTAMLALTGGAAALGVLVLLASVLWIEGPDKFTLAELKAALASPALRRTAVWRRRLGALCGALLIACGVLGMVFVLGPAPLRVIAAVAAGYIGALIVWGFVRAR